MLHEDDDDDETIPVARRSLVDRHKTLTQHHALSNDDYSPSDRRLSRLLLNSSCSFDSGVDETLQTPTQLIALYEQTVELAAKNKINAKNAFRIPLVERLPEIMDIIAFDDGIGTIHHEPNFVKAGSVIDTSAKIYGYRVDALHSETQKLNGSIQNEEEDEWSMSHPDQTETIKKLTQRSKPKASSYLVTDLSTISLPYEFDFHPCQPSSMCQWPGGVGFDSVYADMVSYTMYSSSDFALVHGFIDLNSRVNKEYDDNERVLGLAMKTIYDLVPLREVIRDEQEQDHTLGCQPLRQFSFNEDTTESYIETIDECSILDRSLTSTVDDVEENAHDLFSNGLSELRDDPSQFYFDELQSAHTCPTTMVSMDLTHMPSKISFVDHIPQLIRDKTDPSDYNLYDATKLKLFAGPYLWRFTNLLSEPMKADSMPEPSASIIHPPVKHRSACSTRHFKYDFLNGEHARSIDELMSGQPCTRRTTTTTKSAPRRKLLSNPIRSMSVMREKNTHQLRLARRLRPLSDLSSLHHFPDWAPLHLPNIDDSFPVDQLDFDPMDTEPSFFPETLQYDFVRPVHYDKIEVDRNFSKIDAKKLQLALVDEYHRQCTQSSNPITLSTLFAQLIDHGIISSERDQIVSAFYCMLNNCNKNHLYLKSNAQRDDLIVRQQQPTTDSVQLSYSHTIV